MYNFRIYSSYMRCRNYQHALSVSNFSFSKIRLLKTSLLFCCRKISIGKYYIALCLMFLGCSATFAQHKITGIIVNTNGTPIPDATVIIKNTQTGTATNADGSFVIMATAGDVLVISHIGYQTKKVKPVDETTLNISLTETTNNLDAVIVVGYTSEKIKDIAGSVVVVKPKDLVAVPAGQVEQMLQGRVAGLTVITSGEPGAPSQIFLHGIGNFGDVTPLYIIDGVEGNINSINPYDIESLQVLKDAGAYSIYGARGANGVIVVTTKKGGNGKTSITYTAYVGLQEPLNKESAVTLNPKEMGDLIWLGFKNSGQAPGDPLYGNGPEPVMPDYVFAGPDNVGLFKGDPRADASRYNLDSAYQIVEFNKKGTDWFHQAFNPAISQNHNIGVSGGNDKNKYLFNFGYLDQNGTLLNTYLKRYTARINTDFTVRNNIRIGENIQFSYVDNPVSYKGNLFNSLGEITSILITPSYLPVYDIKGNWTGNGNENAGPGDNPIFVRTVAKDNKNNNWQVFGNAYAEADFLKHFTIRSSFGGSLNYFYAYNFSYGSYAPPPMGYLNSFSESSGYARSWTWTNTLNFSETFWGKHHLKALIGTEEISDYSRGESGGSSGLYSNNPDYWFLNNGDPQSQTNFSFATSSLLASFISRLDYSFADKYIFSATLRRDGSSVFGPENRFGWFPAIMGAWRITQERFMQNVSWLNELKVRASWGKTGFNGNINPLNQFTLYNGTPDNAWYDIFGNSNGTIAQGFRTVNIGNPHTGWQEDEVTNLGLENILWNGKLSITADWYVKNSKGLLFPVALPDLLGIATPPNVNIGNVKNTGIDLLLGTKGNFSKEWSWDANVTFSAYKNTILKLSALSYLNFDSLQLNNTALVRNEVGHPVGSFYGYKIIGYFNDAEDVSKSPVQDAAAPGRFKYLDANGDGHITDSDRVFIGNPNPKFTLGVNIGINYKSFDFSTFFYGVFGNDVVNEFAPSGKTSLYDSWSPQNMTPKAPIVENDNNFSNWATVNSYQIEKGSFLKNKSTILGYTLPKKSLDKIGVNRFRIYVQVANLFTITKYTGLDPEIPGFSKAFGLDGGTYPNNQIQYLMGLDLNF